MQALAAHVVPADNGLAQRGEAVASTLHRVWVGRLISVVGGGRGGKQTKCTQAGSSGSKRGAVAHLRVQAQQCA